ncbi:MAG: hypothetical protein KBB52_02810 [Candidatus Omnitrophica bacterium]|nr:hypothetical protein [Candidatus Omnitrophota bacterium]
MNRINYILGLAIISIAGVAVRIAYIMPPAALEGDAAVFGLIAKHISEAKEFPIYMWLAHYSGTLVSYIGAVLFKWWGVSAFNFLSVSAIASIMWAFAVLWLSRMLFGKEGRLAAFFWAMFPPATAFFYIMDMSNANTGGLFFGTLIICILFGWKGGGFSKGFLNPFSLGLCAGIGMWLSPAMMPFILTTISALYVYGKNKISLRAILYLIFGFVIGYCPAIIYNLQYPGASFTRMAGRILNLDRSLFSTPNFAHIVISQALWRVSTIPASLGMLPGLIIQMAGLLNTAIFFAGVGAVILRGFKKSEKDEYTENFKILLIFILWFVLFYAILVGENRTRFMVPLAVVMPLFIGKILFDLCLRSRFLYIVLFLSLISVNFYSLNGIFFNRHIPAYSKVSDWLGSNGIAWAFSDYDSAYAIVFDSKERIMASPTLFHPKFADRRPEYTEKVRETAEFAYIINKDRYPGSAPAVARKLKSLGVDFRVKTIEDFCVYYALSKRIYPEELGLKE